MTLPGNRDQREYEKFVAVGSDVAVRVNPVTGTLVPDSYDYISVAYPTSTTETYTYKTGGSGGTTVATITITYTDSTKEDISSVEKS